MRSMRIFRTVSVKDMPVSFLISVLKYSSVTHSRSASSSSVIPWL